MFSSHLWMRSPISPNKTGVSNPTQARAALRTAELTAISNKTLATCSSVRNPRTRRMGQKSIEFKACLGYKANPASKSQGWGCNSEASTCLVLVCKVLGWPVASPEWHEVFTATMSKVCAFLVYFHWISTKVTISFITEKDALFNHYMAAYFSTYFA